MPFKGRLEGAATITPLTPPLLAVSIEGTGNATHLGRFTVEIPHVVNTTNRTSTGTFVFTAANDETLTADFTGQASLTATPGVLSIAETATITVVQVGSPAPLGASPSSACSTRPPA